RDLLVLDQAVEYARAWPRDGSASTEHLFYSVRASVRDSGGRAPSGHSLNASVNQRQNRPGGGGSGKSATRPSSRSRTCAVNAATSRRRSRPATSTGGPIRTRTRRPKASQLVPLIATGTIGTPAR